jgi:hypothetical protein
VCLVAQDGLAMPAGVCIHSRGCRIGENLKGAWLAWAMGYSLAWVRPSEVVQTLSRAACFLQQHHIKCSQT